MPDFLQRLQQRKLVQWALARIDAAFALIQVLDVVAQRFGWAQRLRRVFSIDEEAAAASGACGARVRTTPTQRRLSDDR